MIVHVSSEFYGRALVILALLFAFRVVAQAASIVAGIAFLPPFETWQSGVVPYPILLASQVLILVFMVIAIRRARHIEAASSPWRHRLCLFLGSIYFAVMLFRLAAGQTFLAESSWFAKPLPAAFHLVLATFLLVLGQIWRRNWRAQT